MTCTRWQRVAVVTTAAALLGADASARDCGTEAARTSARFEHVAQYAVDACLRRGARSGSPCPDRALTKRLARFRRNLDTVTRRRCPHLDVAPVLASTQARLFCERLAVCTGAPPSMTFRITSAAPTAPVAAGLGAAPAASMAAGLGVSEAGPLAPHLAVDAGWTGIAHHLQIMEGATFEADLADCDGITDTACTLHGARAGTPFGAPSPISAGGVAICVTVTFDSDLDGTVDLASGDLGESARVRIDVFLSPDADEPCPACVPDDDDPQLGEPGTCHGGSRNGLACTVGGLADPDFGVSRATSGDCPPISNARIAEFVEDVAATTGIPEEF